MLKAVKELFPSIEPEHSIVFTQRGALGSRAWKYKRELKENVSRELSGLYWREYSVSPGKPPNQQVAKGKTKASKQKHQQHHQSLEAEKLMTELLQYVI